MAEQLDIDFRDYVIAPAETYADTMRLHHGWSSPARGLDGELLPHASFVADTDGVYEHIEAMQRCAAALYRYFGGTEEAKRLMVSDERLGNLFSTWHDLDNFWVWGSEEEVVGLAQRYLRGDGDDYKRFWGLVTLHGLDKDLPSTEPPEWW